MGNISIMLKYTILFDEQLIVIESKSEIYFGIRQNKTQGHLLININTDTFISIVYRPDTSQK